MLTKEQFATEYRACQREATLAVVGVSVLWGFAFVVVSIRLKPWFQSHSIAEGSFLVLALVLLAICYGVVAKVLHRRHGLICPLCGDWIGSQRRMLSTGRCPRCDTEMFYGSKQSDEPNANTSPHRVS